MRESSFVDSECGTYDTVRTKIWPNIRQSRPETGSDAAGAPQKEREKEEEAKIEREKEREREGEKREGEKEGESETEKERQDLHEAHFGVVVRELHFVNIDEVLDDSRPLDSKHLVRLHPCVRVCVRVCACVCVCVCERESVCV